MEFDLDDQVDKNEGIKSSQTQRDEQPGKLLNLQIKKRDSIKKEVSSNTSDKSSTSNAQAPGTTPRNKKPQKIDNQLDSSGSKTQRNPVMKGLKMGYKKMFTEVKQSGSGK